MLYFEDFSPGQEYELGSYTLTREELLEFARKYDPQPFHIDEEQAKKSLFKELIASGWQTTAIYMKLFVESMMGRAAGMGSPGLDELRWKRPVRPGDVLSGTFRILECKPYRRNIGLVRADNILTNQEGKVVLAFVGLMLFQCRPE